MIVHRESKYSDEVFYISRVTWSVFVIEMFVRIIAEGNSPWQYFNASIDPWNLFDFVCVVCASPWFQKAIGFSLAGLRMLRIIKTMYKLKSSESVAGVVKGFFKAIAACKFLLPIWGVIIYIWAMLGVQTFRYNDPDRFGSFQASTQRHISFQRYGGHSTY